MSAIVVRAAQFGRIFSLAWRYLCRESEYVTLRAWTGTGQTDIQHVDAEIFHEVKKLDLGLDGWIANGWRLQAVAQGLVIQQDGLGCQRSCPPTRFQS